MNIFIPDVGIRRDRRTVVGHLPVLVASSLAGKRLTGHLSVKLRSAGP